MIHGKGYSWDVWCKGERTGGTVGKLADAKERAESARKALGENMRHSVCTIEGPRGAVYRLRSTARRSGLVWRSE